MSAILAIDTAGQRLQLALLLGDRLDVSIDDIATGHAEILFARIGALLDRNGLAYADLARLVAISGPGSFTGLRIGLSAARGLGLALGVPVIGLPTLLAMSLSAEAAGPFAIAVPAHRGEAYLQAFAGPGQPDGPVRVVPEAGTAGARIERFCDIGASVRFAAEADPGAFPPEPVYVRDADAKPQAGARIARREPV